MSLGPGQLNKSITLKRVTESRGAMGAVTLGTPTTLATVFAKQSDLSTREVMEYQANKQLNSYQATRFTVLLTSETSVLTPKDYVTEGANTWDILTTRAIENERWLEILCTRKLTA